MDYLSQSYENSVDYDQYWTIGHEKYVNVTINVWLFKGSHHFVQCSEDLRYKYFTKDDETVRDGSSGTFDEEVTAFSALCVNDTTYYPIKMIYDR